MKAVTLRHRVGSLLVVGVDSTSLGAVEAAWIRSLQPSGLLLFRRNIESAAQVHGLLQQAARQMNSPLFRCIDMEGGTVDRLRDLIGPTPSAAEVAASQRPVLFREHGALIGRMLHALGFNVDLAPVLDLALAEALPVMTTRVISSNPADVITYAEAFLAGLARHDVLGCGKHFPGLGGGNLDSHRATPVIRRNWQQMWQQDLAPYRALALSLPMITISHAAYPEIERQPKPASLSRFWIQEVLRGKLRYRGLVTSDDMAMGGVLQNRSPEQAAIEAIAAGTDLLEVCQGADRILMTHESLLREAERSPAFARCVTQAAKRIEGAKRRWLKDSALPPPLSASGLKQLRAAQQRLREKVARANTHVNGTHTSSKVTA